VIASVDETREPHDAVDARTDDDVASLERNIERCFIDTLRDHARTGPFVAAVSAFAVVLRDEGYPIERVVVRLKETIRRAHTRSRHRDFRLGDFYVGEQLAATAVSRCIERFYRGSEPPKAMGKADPVAPLPRDER
jgi:hypothetical protein